MAKEPPRSLLRDHFAAVEGGLLALSERAANSGHSVHQGTAREAFIREFLDAHVAERLGVGTGEIIASDSKRGEKRNQIDVIVYDRRFPRIHLGGPIYGFLAESVVAAIEIKTTLDKEELRKSIEMALAVKALPRSLRPVAPGIEKWAPRLLFYVVAYSGYENLTSVQRAIAGLHREKSIVVPPPVPDAVARIQRVTPSIDGVLLLGKGYVQFDNAYTWFMPDELRAKFPDINWEIVEEAGIGLHHLYMMLISAADMGSFWTLDGRPYRAQTGVDSSKVTGGADAKEVPPEKAG